MKTLAIIAQKGGSGKTTLAVHLTVCAARHDLHTALIDLDPQASAFKWNESRDEADKLDAIKTTPPQLAGLLEQAKKGKAAFVVIDTAPHSDSAAAIAAQVADFVLIPCRPARFDLDAIASTVEIARFAKTPAAVVLNAVPPRGSIGHEARETLKRQHIPVTDVVTCQRVAYTHAVIDGRSVHEYEPDGKAAAEVDALFHWLRTKLKV
jgi:chromosome partitioning protein